MISTVLAILNSRLGNDSILRLSNLHGIGCTKGRWTMDSEFFKLSKIVHLLI